jgi:mono/diheme cytochrome c family protein
MINKRKTGFAVCMALLAISTAPVVAQSTDTTSVSGGLVLPVFDAAKGRKLFGSKGCVVCHAINGIGGTDAPDLAANHMESQMNPFDFAAKMWKGAPAMIAMQESELGAQIELTGEELAAIIAFAHNPAEQAKFSENDVPAAILAKISAD